MDESSELACPLCTELLDATDRACEFCQCGYSMCLWCWHQLMENAAKENLKGRCPNCRSVYDKQKITQQAMAPSQLEEVAKEAQKNKKPERKASGVQARPRRDLASVRVVQRNLVYVVGLSMDICHEDTLRTSEFFGQFGKPVKVSVNRSMPTGMAHAKGGASGSAYVTFRKSQEAQRCVETIDGITWSGRIVRACFGTTKYCNAFLKGIVCNNADCLYLHAVAEDADSFTKEAMLSGAPAFSKFASLTQLPPKARVGGGALPMHSATASSLLSQPIAPPAPHVGTSQQRNPATAAPLGHLLSSLSGGSGGSGSGNAAAGPASGAGGGAGPESPTTTAAAAVSGGSGEQGSWAAVSAAPSTPVAVPPPRPPGESASDQEWPSLGGATPPPGWMPSSSPALSAANVGAGISFGNSAGASGSPAEQAAQQSHHQPEGGAMADTGSGDTMAAQIARAHAVAAKQAGLGARTAAKKAQQGMLPARGRGAKTLVPPPPPLTSSTSSEPVQGPTALALSSHPVQAMSTTLQLKKSVSRVLPPSNSAVRDAPSEADQRSAPGGMGSSHDVSTGYTSTADQFLREHSIPCTPTGADACTDRGVLSASTATSEPHSLRGDNSLAASRPRSKPAGPPPGFDRGPIRGPPPRVGGMGLPQQPQQLQQQEEMGGGYRGQHGGQPAMMGSGGAGALAAGRTQSRFSFARGSGSREGPMYSEHGGYGPGAEQQQWQPHMGGHSAGAPPAYAPPGSGFPGEALLRQLQQNGASGADRHPLHRGPQTGPSLQEPSILSARPGSPGMQPPGMGSYMPGLTSGFRPGSRGPPPGFTGYLSQQAAPQAAPQAPPLHPAGRSIGEANGSVAVQNGFAGAHTQQPNGGAAPEASAGVTPAHEMSPGAKGRRRKGKIPPSVASAGASQFPASASLHDSETLAGRLQQAKERFYSLNS